jgi:hypothetical protein
MTTFSAKLRKLGFTGQLGFGPTKKEFDAALRQVFCRTYRTYSLVLRRPGPSGPRENPQNVSYEDVTPKAYIHHPYQAQVAQQPYPFSGMPSTSQKIPISLSHSAVSALKAAISLSFSRGSVPTPAPMYSEYTRTPMA